jgi:hypothetical protein
LALHNTNHRFMQAPQAPPPPPPRGTASSNPPTVSSRLPIVHWCNVGFQSTFPTTSRVIGQHQSRSSREFVLSALPTSPVRTDRCTCRRSRLLRQHSFPAVQCGGLAPVAFVLLLRMRPATHDDLAMCSSLACPKQDTPLINPLLPGLSTTKSSELPDTISPEASDYSILLETHTLLVVLQSPRLASGSPLDCAVPVTAQERESHPRHL